MTEAFTPHLIARGAGDLVTVSSGIAFLPFPLMPSYAGVHAYTEAVRAQFAPLPASASPSLYRLRSRPQAGQVYLHALPLDGFLAETAELI